VTQAEPTIRDGKGAILEHGRDGDIDEQQARAARARRAFDQDLRAASEVSTRAARRVLVPALWGAALIGGVLTAIGLVRMFRRPSQAPALLRITIEPPPRSKRLLPAVGGAVARYALQRVLAQHSSPDRLGIRGNSRDAGSAGYRINGRT
jgi:hypothetical protein